MLFLFLMYCSTLACARALDLFQSIHTHVQAVVVPFVGVLGNMVNRIRLITLGALVWAAMSLAFGLSTNYSEVSSQPAVPR